MKHRALSLVLILALLLSPCALASQALGWELYRTDTTLGPGVVHTSQVLWGDSRSDYRREQFVTYAPGQGSAPVVCYGSTLLEKRTLTQMARGLEEYGQRVLAGANGDYFVMASGAPLGMVVTWGVLRSSSSYHYAVGVNADGSVFVGKPDLGLWADFHGYHLSVSGGYNKDRDNQGGYHLYSADYGATTRAKGDGLSLILRPVEVPADYVPPALEPVEPPEVSIDPVLDPETGEPLPEADQQAALEAARQAALEQAQQEALAAWEQALVQSTAGFATLPAQLTIGGEVTCVVEQVLYQPGAVEVPADRLVLTVGRQSNDFLLEALEGLRPGEQVKLSVTAGDPRWAEAESAIGAYAWILQNGTVPEGLDQTADPRTALGVKADGAVILYTVDGRRPGHSVGASVQQVAARLKELGCVDAVLFDGGGSTTFGTTGALDSSFTLQNRPSEGSQRAVTNALFFVSQTQPTGALGSVYLSPQSALMLSGSRQDLTAWGVDTGYYPMGTALDGVTYTASGPGRMEGSTFIAGAERGVATVTAQTPNGAQGTALMTVIATPGAIRIADAATGKAVTSVNLDPGQSLDLNASATWYKLDLLSDDGCFTWTVTPEVGTVDAAGVLTAGSRAASGALSVTAGERTVSIPVTVGGRVITLEPWESAGNVPQLDPEGPVWAELTQERVRYGHSALAVRYPSWEEGRLPLDLPIAAGESYLSLWMYADTPPLAMKAELTLADGSATTVSLTLPEDGKGTWSRVWAAIPENTVKLNALLLTCDQQVADPVPGVVVPSGIYIDQLYLDHFTTANGPIADTTPPTAQLTVRDGAVTATLSDNVDKTFDPARLSLTLDGWGLDFTLEGSRLTARTGVADGLFHRVSLSVQDASGNLSRTGVDLPPTGERQSPFDDVEGHWARNYILYLYDHGVVNGRGQGFDPQASITRAEFATMLWRWLRREGTAAGTQLPFVDAGEVPAWAAEAVENLYAMGILTGSLEADGLRVMANAPITRAQAMTMLGRVQPRGYRASEDLFADHADVPAWAADHLYSLAAQGVVSGYEGYVRPQDPITRAEAAKLFSTLW